MNDDLLWRTKLAAWTHDPAEKALVLLRDPAGHEGGTVRALRDRLFGRAGVPAVIAENVTAADHWASAADRPQLPYDQRYPAWARIDFAASPRLVHPLSGEWIELRPLTEVTPAQIKAVSLDHLGSILDALGPDATDRQRALALWRFGPSRPAPDLGALWRLLPADTRVPDHGIWAHLDVVSAFATAFAVDPEHRPALLTVSFGPVQGFIAHGRTSSDLWAGSHLLSRIAWEGMRIVAERAGPECILLPQLRGIPLVDLWLWREEGLPRALFDEDELAEWAQGGATDHNPLFTAALPNRFVALVPASLARELGQRIAREVPRWVLGEARVMLEMVFEEIRAEQPLDPKAHCWRQLEQQLADFPEVRWAAAAWPVARGASAADARDALARSLAPFHPPADAEAPGLLGEPVWSVLTRTIELQGARLFDSNAGAIFPAVLDLARRAGDAAGTLRPFGQLEQRGFRDSLAGEEEWLCIAPEELELPPGQRKGTLWVKLWHRRRAWVREGEHLGARSMIKRLWPTRFARWLDQEGVLAGGVRRYVLSTHTAALASSLEALIDRSIAEPDEVADVLEGIAGEIARYENERHNDRVDRVALPRRLALRLNAADRHTTEIARKLPALLDALRKDEVRRARVEGLVAAATGVRPEAYYALVLLDEDHMGAWLTGTDPARQLRFEETWRGEVREGLKPLRKANSALNDYLRSERSASPARLAAISEALNAFSLGPARTIIEDRCKGKLLYAGGDDVLAMVSIDELPQALWGLRFAYSGEAPPGKLGAGKDDLDEMRLGRGFTRLGQRLLRMMGSAATASAGAVIAHHMTPLGTMLRAVRTAEQAAKEAGRDRFCLRILKRSGGELTLTAPWKAADSAGETARYTPLGLLLELRDELARSRLSRRVAYVASDWLGQLPVLSDAGEQERLLADSLAHAFQRATDDPGRGESLAGLAREVAMLAVAVASGFPPRAERLHPAVAWTAEFLSVAEFLAREGRAGAASPSDPMGATARTTGGPRAGDRAPSR